MNKGTTTTQTPPSPGIEWQLRRRQREADLIVLRGLLAFSTFGISELVWAGIRKMA